MAPSITLSHFDPDASDAEAVRLALWDIFRDILEEGQTYPQTEEEVKDIHDFAQYYLAFDVILCRRTEDGKVQWYTNMHFVVLLALVVCVCLCVCVCVCVREGEKGGERERERKRERQIYEMV